MRSRSRTLFAFAQLLFGLLLLLFLVGLPAAVGLDVGMVGALLLLLANGWAVYAFLRYRQGRQDELAQVLAAVVEGDLPLAPAVRSYLIDLPRDGAFRSTFRVAAKIALPLYTYTRLWIGWRRYDQLVGSLAKRLEEGDSLSESLRKVPGVSSREVRMAAAVGEATGGLGPRLQGAVRERWSAAWLEVAPRLLYPFVVLVFVSCIATFLMVYIVPRFKRIFDEFGQSLPPTTLALIDFWLAIEEILPLVPLAILLGLMALSATIANPSVRWRTPILGRLYRWGMQGEVLRSLGQLLAVGRTVPQSLAFLGESADLPVVVRKRIGLAMTSVERGEPLDEALGGAGLLPSTMAPLVRSAERARTLPWAMNELGDHLSGRAFRLVRRISLVVSPILVVAVGAVVGFLALALFLPLIKLLGSLSE